jgi:hypothetical protein
MLETIIGTLKESVWLVVLILVLFLYWVTLKKEVFTYTVEDSQLDSGFKTAVQRILRGSKWNKYRAYREARQGERAMIRIKLAHRDDLAEYRDKTEYYDDAKTKPIRFSYTVHPGGDSDQIKVLIDHRNWLDGVSESGLSVLQYREYVINHEFGHALGYDHQPCEPGEGTCPVMYQSTRGCPRGRTCGFEPTPQDLTKILPYVISTW